MIWIIPLLAVCIGGYFLWRKIKKLPEVKKILEEDEIVSTTEMNLDKAKTTANLAKKVKKVNGKETEKNREAIKKFNQD